MSQDIQDDEPEEEELDGVEDDEAETDGRSRSSGYPGGAEAWDEILACPLEIRFTQDKIHPFFYRRGPIVNVLPKIRAVGNEDGSCDLVPPFAPIHCLRKGSVLWSLDNRRLYALQLVAMDLWPRPCRVRCLSRERLPRHKLKTQYRKFNTRSDGRTIAVTTRYQNFDTWNWQERAAEIELYSLSKRLSVVFTTFEALPVLGAMLFRTGYTGLQSRWPLIISFLLAFSLDFTRQQVPFLEKQLCLLQVQAIQREESLIKLSWQGDDVQGVCKLQLAAIMAITLLMMLPCIFGIAEVKVRSSVFSCWLGVAFMLLIQLMFALQRTESSEKVDDAAEAASDNEEGSEDKAADKAKHGGESLLAQEQTVNLEKPWL